MASPLPLAGIRVVEFSHMVMGPSCGLVLGRSRRRRDQGRAGRGGRQYAAAAGLGRRLLPGLQSQQAQPARSTCPIAKGLAFARRLIARADVLIENFRPGGLDRARARLRGARAGQSAPHLLLAQGVSRRPLREPRRARRGGADDGRARLHDGPPGPAAARRRSGQRHHGRHVRRHRHPGGAARARRAPAAASWCAARCSRTTRSWSRPTWRNSPSPECRRRRCRRASPPGPSTTCSTPRDGKQIFIAVVTDTQWRTFCDGFRSAWTCWPTRACDQSAAGRGPRASAPAAARAVQGAHPGRDQPHLRGRRNLPLRRSGAPTNCSTTRISTCRAP